MANSLGFTPANITEEQLDILVKLFFAANMTVVTSGLTFAEFVQVPSVAVMRLEELTTQFKKLTESAPLRPYSPPTIKKHIVPPHLGQKE